MEIYIVLVLLTCVLIIQYFKPNKKATYFSKIILNNKGFNDIRIGDTFEGCACGHFWSNQICTKIKGDLVYGTTTLVVFRKDFIRPINKKDNKTPYLESNFPPNAYDQINNNYFH